MIALLLNHLWQSSVFVGGAGLIALALRRNGATARFWVWFAASLKFLVPFAALTALSAYALKPMVPPMAVPTVTLVEPLAKPFSAPAMVQITASLTEPSAPPPFPTLPTHSVVSAQSVVSSQTAVPAHVAPPAFPKVYLNLESALLALWAAGFLILAIRWLARWLRLRALLRAAIEAQIDAPVVVKFSASRLEPGLVGILRPVILLPQGIDRQLSPAELQAVLAHELCHWRRRDNLLAAMHMLVEALFWFFPLVWWLGARLNAERECACDESVLADGNDPRIYAEGILKVCRAYLQSPLACVAGVSGAGLKKRIEAIVENRLALQLNAVRKLVLSASAAAALVLPLALGLMAAPVAPMPAKAAPAPLPVKTAQSITGQQLPLAAETAVAALPAGAAQEQVFQTNKAATASADVAMTPPTASLQSLPVAASAPEPAAASNDPPSVPPASKSPPAAVVALNDQPGVSPATSEVAANTNACAPPQLINSLPMEKTPSSDTMTVTANFDGGPQRLLVGISDTPTQLWNSRAAKLGLPVRAGRRTMDGGGRISEDVARVESLTLGSMETSNFEIQVTPDPDFANAGSDGVLGTDMMQRYDIDLDFANRQLNYFTPEQCKGVGIYWAPSKVTSVQMKTYANVVYVPVTLDGHTLVAILDTSASRTFLNPRTASQLFGVKADGLESGNVTDGSTLIKAGVHRFSSLSFGGLALGNPRLAVPFDILSQSYEDPHASRTARNTFYLSEILPDIVIGMDVLKQSHLYISFQNQRVYVSPAGDGQPLKQQTPVSVSRFNVWRYGYDPYYNFRHPQIKF